MSDRRGRGPVGDIRVVDVSHSYRSESGGTVQALEHIDLEIPAGQFVAVVGPSGCGKTTLLRILAGFVTPTQGRALLRGRPIEEPSWERGVVFQHANLFPWLTVRGNVELGPRYRRLPRVQRRARAEAFLDLVGLADFGDARPYELSGGMQQRCQIARVLANEPQIVLMDEPFGALDSLTRQRLQRDLLTIHREQGATFVFITHSVEEAVFLAERVLVLSPRPGRVVLDQPIELGHRSQPAHLSEPAHRSERAHRSEVGEEVRSSPEFIALRDRVAAAIQES